MLDLRKQRALVVCGSGRLVPDLTDEVKKLAHGSTLVSYFYKQLLGDFIYQGPKITGFEYRGDVYNLIIVTSDLFLTISPCLREFVLMAARFDEPLKNVPDWAMVVRYGKKLQPA